MKDILTTNKEKRKKGRNKKEKKKKYRILAQMMVFKLNTFRF